MIRAPAVDYPMKVLFIYITILEKILKMPFGKLAVKTFYKSNRLFTRNMPIPDLVGRIGCAPTNPEFDISKVIVKSVEFIIQARVLAVGTFIPIGICLKATVFDGIIIILLGYPFMVITKEVLSYITILDLRQLSP